jgi:hypothetical protein
MQPACPWTGFAQTTSSFCEEAVCGVVREPANTWSNVGFFVVGFAMLRLDTGNVPRLVRRFGYVCIFLGVGSALFHATRTYLGGLLDTAGMQGAAAFMLAACARRLAPNADPRAAEKRDAHTFWSIAMLGTALAVTFEQHERRIFVIEMIAASVMELLILRRTRITRADRWLGLSWMTFVPAYTLWWLDRHHVACHSSAHLVNGHAAWHLLMAASLFCIQRFHAELAARPARSALTAAQPETTGESASLGRAAYRV